MSLSYYECRARYIKQFPSKQTKRRGETQCKIPGPEAYKPPELIGGKGYSHIRRAPAYSIGHFVQTRCAREPKAPLFDISGQGVKGPAHIPGGVLSYKQDNLKASETPGPGAYDEKGHTRHRRPPAYTMRSAIPPKKDPWDMWTPSPNFYLPPLPGRKEPTFSIGQASRELKPLHVPGPSDHNPNFNYVKKTLPKFSFASASTTKKQENQLGPGYCWKKFMGVKKSAPAYSFGIKHSPYLGQQQEYLQLSGVNIETY